MLRSTKGGYALRVLIDLAEHRNGGYIPMKDIAEQQGISLKYLERIVPELTKNKYIEGVHGKGGGYKLIKEPSDCNVWDILCVTEEDLAPVSCLKKDAPTCSRAAECVTLPMWDGFYKLTRDYFSGITLADLMSESASDNYVI